MKPEEIKLIRQVLPDEISFPYYADRESAWLLAQLMPECADVAALRRGPAGKLLNRPAVRPVVAKCGGRLHQRDVLAVAHADQAMRITDVGAAGLAGVKAVFDLPWRDFGLTFAEWGTRGEDGDQTTRQQGNLVLQLSFPSDHADLMGRYLPQKARKDYEFSYHPIRTRGRPTLAWARLDIDLSLGEALIEEVQSDWLRDARVNVARLRDLKPRSRALAALERYEAGLVGRYGRIWPRALMLAALVLIRDEFACRTVWMHQPGAGELFKGMEGAKPPRSLYTALPKSFCFAPVRSWPGFLKRLPNRRINRLPDSEPLFWRLEFST